MVTLVKRSCGICSASGKTQSARLMTFYSALVREEANLRNWSKWRLKHRFTTSTFVSNEFRRFVPVSWEGLLRGEGWEVEGWSS